MDAKKLNITMRRASGTDAEFVATVRNQPSSLRFQVSPPRTVAEIEVLLAAQQELPASPETAAKLYWLAEISGEPAGILQLDVSDGNRIQQYATMGYTVAESFQGRGVATSMASQAAAIGFGAGGLGLGRIEAVAAVENYASRRVLEKAGYRFEGILRGLLIIQGQRVDHACYGLLNTDPWEG